MTRLVLASTSRYRRELLARLGVPFEACDPCVDEAPFKKRGLSPKVVAETLAREKARAVAPKYPGALVIGSDQLATIDDETLGKPATIEAALAQLRRLVGREHELITATAFVIEGRELLHTDITRLRMRQLDDAALLRYLEADQPLDCAGSYKIESLGIALFDSIETADPTAIQGLPLSAVARALTASGITVP